MPVGRAQHPKSIIAASALRPCSASASPAATALHKVYQAQLLSYFANILACIHCATEQGLAAYRNDLGVGVEELPVPSRVCGPQHLPHPATSYSCLEATPEGLYTAHVCLSSCHCIEVDTPTGSIGAFAADCLQADPLQVFIHVYCSVLCCRLCAPGQSTTAGLPGSCRRQPWGR